MIQVLEDTIQTARKDYICDACNIVKDVLEDIREYLTDEEKNRFKNGKCPKCSSHLVIRTNKNDKSKFLGCSKYPNCKYTENYVE